MDNETLKAIGVILALGYFSIMLAYDLTKNKNNKGNNNVDTKQQ